MGKNKPFSNTRKKMADLVTERKKSTVFLKRRTSVRASLRFIGTKFLSTHHQHEEEHETPAVEYKRSVSDEDRSLMTLLPHYFIKSREEERAKSKKKVKTTTPPAVVAKKAARLLQIPSRAKGGMRGGYGSVDSLEVAFQNEGYESEGQSQLVFNFDPPTNTLPSTSSSRRLSRDGHTFRKIRHASVPEWLVELPAVAGETDMDVAVADDLHNLPLVAANHKPTKKEAKLMQQRLDKLARVTNHLPALFDAVQHGYMEKARTILESTDVNVNSLNSDGLSPLDIAVLSNNRQLVKMLISFGAKEGSQFTSADKFGLHLKQLLGEAEMRLQEHGGFVDEPCGAPPNNRASFSSIIGNAYPTSSVGCAGGDNEKQVLIWERRAKALRRLVLGFAQARPPDPPSLIALDLTSSSTVAVRLHEATSIDSPITTKFKVQWSTRADFSVITGEKDIIEMTNPCCRVELTQGRRYFFRAACGNLKGYGIFVTSTPTSVVPSTWREIQQKEHRFNGKLKKMDQLVGEVRQFRPGSEILDAQVPQRRAQRKKTTIKQLFTAASKFQKNLRRGIHLACVLYHEDKVLVTNEDFLPVIEIDETFPSSLYPDLHWFMKVACTWDDTKTLRADMEKNTSSAIHFRSKLLSAAVQMQSSLCLQDLGQVYFKPLRDGHGTAVISTINYVKTPKSVSVLNSRWLPMNKVLKKLVVSDEHATVSDILMASIQEQINYHQVASLRLGRGLYLAYLKMQSSMDVIQVVVSAKSPNMLPHCKIRDNPHVSAEEWKYLKQQHLPDILDNATELQRTFLELVTSAAKRLFNYMDVSNEDAGNHRLYESEVVDLTDEVSFIVVCPPAESSCSVPGQREMLLQRADLLSLPLQVFEMIHLNTYHNNLVKKYAKLNCLLELDAATATHLHREAFSNSEVAVAKERLTRLQELQSRLNGIWKSIRWLMDVIAFARDRVGCGGGVSMRYILEKEMGSSTWSSPKRSLLELPPRDNKVTTKSSPGRGSWPGPGTTVNTTISLGGNLISEFSKSEQHLSTNETSHYLSARSDLESRKNSDSFTSDYIGSTNLVPSRSEDVLIGSGRSDNSISSTSPLLTHRALRTGSTLSVATFDSLSSDGDGVLRPIDTSTPNKSGRPRMAPSKSMTNVKENGSTKTRSKFLSVGYPAGGPAKPLQSSSLSKSLTNIKSTVERPAAAAPSSSSEDPQSGILQVFAAYETGLANGTSLKLHVTPRTTAREVVDLVVKQLNMAVLLKGKDGPVYGADKLKNFCLVAVIGARERCLRDDFKPLQLQNPWKKGRLYVRQKQEVLAALEHSSRHTTII